MGPVLDYEPPGPKQVEWCPSARLFGFGMLACAVPWGALIAWLRERISWRIPGGQSLGQTIIFTTVLAVFCALACSGVLTEYVKGVRKRRRLPPETSGTALAFVLGVIVGALIYAGITFGAAWGGDHPLWGILALGVALTLSPVLAGKLLMRRLKAQVE